MVKQTRINLPLLLIAALLLQGAVSIHQVQAQAPINFSETAVENNFPDEMVFRVTVTSPGAEIVKAKFAYTSENLYGSRSYTKDPIEFTPGPAVQLEYVLDTRDLTTPPQMTYLYHWEVEDAAGQKVQSEDILIRYEDNRYSWQVLENEEIGVWWHDRPAAFGQTIFDIAANSVSDQQGLFQADLDFQIRIVISNSDQEFNSWHHIDHDWIGGQTFSDYGITNQIVQGESYQDSWLNGVIPHEISHIFFNQVVYNPTVSVPVWLNEGVAQFNEFTSHDWEIDLVDSAAAEGGLIPLTSLEDGFGSYDVDRVYLSYAEAYSAAAFLVGTYGNEGLSALLAAYKAGEPKEQAFQTALGISADQFELDWAESVGAANYHIPTPWVMPTFRPSPTLNIAPGQGTAIPGLSPEGTPAPPSGARQGSGEEESALAMGFTSILILALVITVLAIGIGLGLWITHQNKNKQS